MNEILISVLSVVITGVVIPLITWAGTALVKWLNTKVKNEKSAEFLTTATTIVLNSVKTVFQTYVESLKKNGSFDEASQKLALTKAKEIALSQFNDEVTNYITDNYGDFNNWLTIQIEATIDSLKHIK
ncbi:hypothetical protein LJC17_03055 [Acholeplasma sp. OttesenSCG-928-E16]|nr:hypothetical protein [Acholeplasma sp. OttesenSCG-928-E16]